MTFIGALHLLHCLAFLFGSGRFPVDFHFSASNNAVCSATKNNSSNYYIIISYIKRIIMQFVVCFVYDNICVGVNNCSPKVRGLLGNIRRDEVEVNIPQQSPSLRLVNGKAQQLNGLKFFFTETCLHLKPCLHYEPKPGLGLD